jgi:hypothetical protein
MEGPRRRGRTIATIAIVASLAVLVSMLTASVSLAAPGEAQIGLANDANHDGVFNNVENVPKNVTYPWVVTFRLSITSGPLSGPGGAYHTIRTITDADGADLSGCQSLVGMVVPVGQTVSCTYTLTINGPQTTPLTDTATFTFDQNAIGLDTGSSTSTVNFPAMALAKSSTTAWVYQVGQVVPYTYTVTNTGTSTLTGITVADNNVDSTPVCQPTTLAPTQQSTCTATHTVTAADLAGTHLTNLATASSNEAPDATAPYSIPVAGSPAGGDFVIGDQTYAANPATVTFWGAQWWKLNSLSGGSGPAAFKGFEDSPAAPVCGQNWTTDPGNSTPPPAGPLPPFMVVIVSSNVTQSGSTIGGDTQHLIVVQTNSGYQGNPGHAGYGPIVATLC